jgi:hypothetical protein
MPGISSTELLDALAVAVVQIAEAAGINTNDPATPELFAIGNLVRIRQWTAEQELTRGQRDQDEFDGIYRQHAAELLARAEEAATYAAARRVHSQPPAGTGTRRHFIPARDL